MKFEIDYIEKLAKIVSKNELSEICLEDSEKAITIRKQKEVITTSVTSVAAPVAQTSTAAPATQAPVSTEVPSEAPKKGTPVTSPMVGTFYQASSPGAEPFVKEGDSVSVGKVVCIIEAMKLMNEIESEVSGKITEICVADGEPVEFGQVLMYVE